MPDGPLAEFGAAWLGWDPRIGKRAETLDIPNLPKNLYKLTKSARKYGLHGTLKPPFRLKTTYAEQDLIHSFEEFCADEGPAISGKIVLQAIGGFLALIPEQSLDQIDRLARNCVTFFDSYRAPLDSKELEKQQERPLSINQQKMLTKWGYPYVFNEFQFHITLIGRVSQSEADHILKILQPDLESKLNDSLKIAK